MEKLKYCSKCGNTGLINGKPCSCKMDRIQYAGLYKKMNVPVQYQIFVNPLFTSITILEYKYCAITDTISCNPSL